MTAPKEGQEPGKGDTVIRACYSGSHPKEQKNKRKGQLKQRASDKAGPDLPDHLSACNTPRGEQSLGAETPSGLLSLRQPCQGRWVGVEGGWASSPSQSRRVSVPHRQPEKPTEHTEPRSGSGRAWSHESEKCLSPLLSQLTKVPQLHAF